jgi:hypothetical protein
MVVLVPAVVAGQHGHDREEDCRVGDPCGGAEGVRGRRGDRDQRGDREIER